MKICDIKLLRKNMILKREFFYRLTRKALEVSEKITVFLIRAKMNVTKKKCVCAF